MANIAIQDTNENQTQFAVYRSGVRVSESVYGSREDARHEHDYWEGILRRWPDGTKMEILPLNYRRRKE